MHFLSHGVQIMDLLKVSSKCSRLMLGQLILHPDISN